jgi:tRNA (mo5U34)-methyltransferase
MHDQRDDLFARGYPVTHFAFDDEYHRRSPMDHLAALRRLLCPGGELVLETLVVEGDAERVLIPPGRYARMRNVWFIPSAAALMLWLDRCGFSGARLVDVSFTTHWEQRSTEWMRFESLAQALNPGDPGQTVEGLTAPRRGILIASA